MLIKSLEKIKPFVAGDNTLIREILHPTKDHLKMNYSMAHASLAEGESSLSHLLHSSEVYYILEGEGMMYIDEDSKKVKKNDIVWIPPNAKQYIQNTGVGTLSFICIVSPEWKEEEEKIL